MAISVVSFSFSRVAQTEARSAGRWLLSLPHLVSKLSGLQTGLVSNCSGLQTNWLPVSPSYIIVQRPLLLVGVTLALIQPIHGQGYNSDIPRPDAPVIYIGVFPILTARPCRRSIYNRPTGWICVLTLNLAYFTSTSILFLYFKFVLFTAVFLPLEKDSYFHRIKFEILWYCYIQYIYKYICNAGENRWTLSFQVRTVY